MDSDLDFSFAGFNGGKRYLYERKHWLWFRYIEPVVSLVAAFALATVLFVAWLLLRGIIIGAGIALSLFVFVRLFLW